MRGSIIKRGDSYRIKVSLGKDPATGKYLSHFETVSGNKKDAERRLNEVLHEHEKGIFVKPGKLTVADYMKRWLADVCLPNMTPRTYEGYEFNVLKYINPIIGHLRLTELKPAQLQHLYSDIQAAGHHRTAQYVHNTINKALNSAVKTGLLARNPASAVEAPKVSRHEMKPMSQPQLREFLELAKKTDYYALFYLALFSGMRRSELLALRWSDCDLPLCQVSVNRTMHLMRYGTYKGQVIFKQPKTAKSRRLISMTPTTALALAQHKDAQSRIRASLNLPALTGEDLVFSQWDGKPLLPDNVSHYWMKLARRAGLNGVRFHDSRHTHATIMLQQGVHPKIVQERLGHVSIETTLDTYSHVAPGLQEAAAAKFDDVVLPREKVASRI